jgi:anti-sigma B factor antagonist
MGLGIVPPMTHTVVESDDGICVIALRGEIDLAGADQIIGVVRAVIGSGRCRRLSLDLRDAIFLDCAGVRALLAAQREAERQGVPLGVTHVHGVARRVMDLTGVYDRLCHG